MRMAATRGAGVKRRNKTTLDCVPFLLRESWQLVFLKKCLSERLVSGILRLLG